MNAAQRHRLWHQDRRQRRARGGALHLWWWRCTAVLVIVSALTTCHITCAILVNDNAPDSANDRDAFAIQPQSRLLSDPHWALIRWYFERVPVIELTQLRTTDHTTTATSGERAEFHKEFDDMNADCNAAASVYSIDIRNASIDSSSADDDGIATDHLNATPQPPPPILQIQDFQARSRRKRYRRDEPRLGAVVHFASIPEWEHFVRAQSSRKHPFHNPAGHYIFIMTADIVTTPSTESAWRDSVARAMHNVFHKHRILHAVFMAGSVDGREYHQIGYYDPFYRRTINGGGGDGMTIAYGAMKWTHLHDIDLQTFWILNLAQNFEGYPFRSAMFRRFPTLIPSAEVSPSYLRSYLANVAGYAANLSGFDGVVLGNLAKHHNFRVVSVLNNDTKYGTKLPNTTFTGVIGDLILERADAAFNSRFIVDYDTDEVDFLYPVFADRYCVIAPAARLLPKSVSMLRCFAPNAWAFLFGTQWLCVLVWLALRLPRRRRRQQQQPPRKHFRNYLQCLVSHAQRTTMDVYRFTLSQAVRLPFGVRERMFLAVCLVVNIIVVGIFQGSLTRSFNRPVTEHEIDTLQQLYDSGLPIISSSSSIRNLFGDDDENALLRALQQRHETREDVTPIRLAAFERSACSVERYSDVRILIKTQYESPDGLALVHVVAQCPRNYHLGYIIKRGSPYKARFNRILLHFFEAGLLRVWYENFEHALIVSRRSHQLPRLHNEPVITLHDLCFTFYIWMAGLAIATVVFVFEWCSVAVFVSTVN